MADVYPIAQSMNTTKMANVLDIAHRASINQGMENATAMMTTNELMECVYPNAYNTRHESMEYVNVYLATIRGTHPFAKKLIAQSALPLTMYVEIVYLFAAGDKSISMERVCANTGIIIIMPMENVWLIVENIKIILMGSANARLVWSELLLECVAILTVLHLCAHPATYPYSTNVGFLPSVDNTNIGQVLCVHV